MTCTDVATLGCNCNNILVVLLELQRSVFPPFVANLGHLSDADKVRLQTGRETKDADIDIYRLQSGVSATVCETCPAFAYHMHRISWHRYLQLTHKQKVASITSYQKHKPDSG